MINCVFSREEGCAVLTKKQCESGKPCSFCKSAKELEAGRKRADARIASLTEEEKAYIQFKYPSRKKKEVTL